MCDFICKIPTMDELIANWDREISEAVEAGDSLENWQTWKNRSVENFRKHRIIPYFGILNGNVITQAVAHIDPKNVQNSECLVDETTAYLSAFRTVEAYQDQGYFSRLFHFMISDLKERGYLDVTLGVEPEEEKNLAIYTHYGFTEKIKSSRETFPDGSVISVDYFRKNL